MYFSQGCSPSGTCASEGNTPRQGPLFRSVRKGGRVGERLHPCQAPRIFKAMAREAGLPEAIVGGLSGHSARVGAAQDMIAAGIELPAIVHAGRWKSTAMVNRYGERRATDCSTTATGPCPPSPATRCRAGRRWLPCRSPVCLSKGAAPAACRDVAPGPIAGAGRAGRRSPRRRRPTACAPPGARGSRPQSRRGRMSCVTATSRRPLPRIQEVPARPHARR